MKKGFAPILLITLITAILLIVGFVAFKQKIHFYRSWEEPFQIIVQTPRPSPSDPTATWKTYKSKDNLYQISYPDNWTVNEMDDVSMGDNAIDISIIEWNDGSKEYAEEQWQSVPCGGGGGGNSEIGCIPMEIKESKKINLNGNPAYWRVDGNSQTHAWIPNKDKNKTIEIYSVLLKDKNLFNQILSTFKFLN